MRDTPPETEAKYRAMLLARSGEERLKMAGSMYASARALAVASIREADPAASSPPALRRALFLRFYGAEFDASARARILARLGAEEEMGPSIDEEGTTGWERVRTRRQVPINWDELETALTWRMDEWSSYLDLRTGEVRQYRPDRFGDEREGWELSEEEADAGLAEGHLLYIEPLSASVEWTWMAEFAASVADPRLRDRLERALRGRGAFRRFKAELAGHPRQRERWFAFHDARVREAMREWLVEHEIEPTTAPERQRDAGRVGDKGC